MQTPSGGRSLCLPGKQMMMKHLLFFTLFLVLLSDAFAQTPEDAAKQAVIQLTETLSTSPLEVEIATLVLENSSISSAFAERFLEQVEDHLKRNEEDYPKVERRSLDPEKLTRGFSLNQNYSASQAKVQDAVLQGTYREAGNKVFVSLRLLAEDGSRIAEAEVPVELAKIQEPYKPAAEPEIREETEALDSMGGLMEDFTLKVELNKGTGAVYHEGDDFEVLVQPEVDSYLKLVYRDVNGSTTTLYESRNPLYAGAVHRLPPRNGGRAQWQIDCSQGCGPETLVVLASTEPFPTEPESASRGWNLAERVRELQERGVSERARQSMTFVSLTTLER